MAEARTLKDIDREINSAQVQLSRLAGERWNHPESQNKRVAQFNDFTWDKYGIRIAHIKDLYCRTYRRDNNQALDSVDLTVCMDDGNCMRRSTSKLTLERNKVHIQDAASGVSDANVEIYDHSYREEMPTTYRLFCMFLDFLFDFSSFDSITPQERDFRWVYCWQDN